MATKPREPRRPSPDEPASPLPASAPAGAPQADPTTGAASGSLAYSVAHALEDLFRRGLLDNADATRQCYFQRAGHLIRLLGTEPLSSLHVDIVQDYAQQRVHEKAARETVRKELCVLRRALDLAHRRGHPMPTPAQIMPRFKTRYVPRKVWLTQAQAVALLQQLAPERGLFVLTAIYTGARLSELEGLEWQDILWTAGQVHVRGTKTGRSDRFVPLHSRLAAALQARRRVRGRLLEPWPNVRRDLAVACRAAGVAIVTPNDLRRTFASWLVQAGESSYVVSQLLGHSSSTMVERVYGRLAPKTLSDAVRKLP